MFTFAYVAFNHENEVVGWGHGKVSCRTKIALSKISISRIRSYWIHIIWICSLNVIYCTTSSRNIICPLKIETSFIFEWMWFVLNDIQPLCRNNMNDVIYFLDVILKSCHNIVLYSIIKYKYYKNEKKNELLNPFKTYT